MIHLMGKTVPHPKDVELLLDLFECAVFPRYDDDKQKSELKLELSIALDSVRDLAELDTTDACEKILASIDAIREELLLDANFCLERDPAAKSIQEVILSYPGFRATLVYRIAHLILKEGVPLLPRMLCERIHSQTGIDIHPGAQIASPFFIDHGTGVVIGETAIVGKNVHMYQGVTLGALAVNKADANVKRHPTIGDNVIIYANSTILGGDTVIGHDSVIGGNTWLTQSVQPYSIVYTEHKTVVRDRENSTKPIDFSI